MSSSTQLDFPSSPPNLVSLCLQKALVEKLPVDDLPVTIQQDLLLLGGGLFVKKKQKILIEGERSFAFGIETSSQIDVKKNDDGYKVFVHANGWIDLAVGDFKGTDQLGKYRWKGWVETRGIYRYVWQAEWKNGAGL